MYTTTFKQMLRQDWHHSFSWNNYSGRTEN